MRFGRLVRALLISSCGILSATIASADTVWIQSGSGNPIAISDVKVTGVEADALLFTTNAGRQTSKPLAQIPQMKLDDEPTFSTAEESFRSSDFPAAVDSYRKTLTTTTRPWLKERCALRLVQSANKSNNFPAAVEGFVDLLQITPALATDNKPAIPKQAASIDQAIAYLQQASKSPQIKADQKTVLGNFLVELYNAKGDTASANAALSRVTKDGANPASATPDNRRVAADLKMTEARQAYSQRQYAKAAQVLNSSGGLFSEPQERADALYLLAQSTAGAVGNSEDPNQLKDAALAYMRVVAFCESMPGKPHVANSLLAVAALEEKLKNTKEALAVYNQVADEFKGTPAATRAKEAAARLGPADKG
jgi:TolA-binding protein